jgi:hypothetical protein
MPQNEWWIWVPPGEPLGNNPISFRAACTPPEDNAESGSVLAEAASAEDKAQDDQDDDNHDDQPEQATHRSLLSASQHDALLKIVVESVSRIHPRPRHGFPENDVREMGQLPAAWRGRKEVYHLV